MFKLEGMDSHNLNRGSNRDELVEILISEKFDIREIKSELRGHYDLDKIDRLYKRGSVETPYKNLEINDDRKDIISYKALDTTYFVNAKRVQTDKINLNIIEDFLDEDTCKYLIKIIRKNNYRSTITTQDTEPDKYFRTSKTCDMPQEDPVVKKLEQQMCDYLGIEFERTETTQGQFYEAGNEFKAHTDWFTRDSEEWNKFAKRDGQRTWTFMLYLNTVEEGGETEYTNLGISMKPKMGMGIIWNNMDNKGQELQDTIHWGKPPIKGEKFVITKWFREYGRLKEPFRPRLGNIMPRFTKHGFEKRTLKEII